MLLITPLSLMSANTRVRRVMRRSWKRSSASTAIDGGSPSGNRASSPVIRPLKIASEPSRTWKSLPNSSVCRSKYR